MDFQKIILWLGIAGISVMLLSEWQTFKEQKAQIDPASKVTQVQPATVQSSPVIASATNGDIPQLLGEKAPTDDIPSATANQQRLITVTTNNLNVTIDTLGGDIIAANLLEHKQDIKTPEQTFALLEQNQIRTYVVQSGLIGPNGTDTQGVRPQFTTASNNVVVTNDSTHVDLIHTSSDGVVVTKRFTFEPDTYLIKQTYLINNQSSQPWVGAAFGQIKRDRSSDPSASDSGMGMRSFLGIATTTTDERYKKFTFDDIAEKPVKFINTGGWIAMSQHYFLSAWIPNQSVENNYSTLVTQNGLNIARYTTPAIEVAAGAQGEIVSQLYLGPKDQYSLEKIAENLDLTVDYGWLWWIAQPLFWVMIKIHSVVGNWGFTIILLTVFVKGVFFQLSAASYKSMANMRRLQPKITELRERYQDDKAKQSQAMMELYKKEKINPLGGCLPILIQMPVFISLYWVLMESIEIRHAPFIGYIQDLSTMDPYYILPLLMGISMFAQQKLAPQAFTDPMQQKIMQWMPVMFTFFFLWFPAGLVLYWVVNNVLSIAQQYVITKRIEAADAARS